MRNLLLGLILAHGIGPCAMPSQAATIGYPPGGGSTSASDLTSGTLPNARLDSTSATLKGNWSLEMPGPIQGASVSASSATISSTTATGTLSTSGDARFGFTVYASSISVSSAVHSGSLTLSSGAVVEKTLWVNEGVRASTLNAINVTSSSNVYTGSLTVSSGAVIGKSLAVTEGIQAATVTVVNVVASSNTMTASLTVSSGAVIASSLWVTDNVAASKFIGDGSALTNLPASSFALNYSSIAVTGWDASVSNVNWTCSANSSMTITVPANGTLECGYTTTQTSSGNNDCAFTILSVKSGDAFAINWANNTSASGTDAMTMNNATTAMTHSPWWPSPFVPTASTAYTLCTATRQAGGITCEIAGFNNINPKFICRVMSKS